MSTALVRRPTTALARMYYRRGRKRRVYRCRECGLYQCVCGTGALSLGRKLAERQERRSKQRLMDAIHRVLAEANADIRRRLTIVPEDDE